MLLLEPEASLAAIPKLLPPGEDERRAGLDAIRERAVRECEKYPARQPSGSIA